ncbi:unnamed protein product, partial [Prorocentrum cordatum]
CERSLARRFTDLRIRHVSVVFVGAWGEKGEGRAALAPDLSLEPRVLRGRLRTARHWRPPPPKKNQELLQGGGGGRGQGRARARAAWPQKKEQGGAITPILCACVSWSLPTGQERGAPLAGGTGGGGPRLAGEVEAEVPTGRLAWPMKNEQVIDAQSALLRLMSAEPPQAALALPERL